MNVIWKFEIPRFYQEIEAPIVKFLTVQTQGNMPCVWAIVDPDKEPSKYKITTVGTGCGDASVAPDSYIGTTQLNGYVWHYFWERQTGERNGN